MNFTFKNLEEQLSKALENGYQFCTCEEYLEKKKTGFSKLIVNRIDIDFNVKKTIYILDIFKRLKIRGTFFVRLHAGEYNPFSFESYNILKDVVQSGNELGYHSEIVDESLIWGEDTAACLKRDIEAMKVMFGVQIKGVASHNGMTGYNNLDFWRDRKASDFGLLYEAYDNHDFNLFSNSFYISDSEWTRWKCYEKGKLVPGDNRTLAEHTKDDHKLIYLLIHPDTYYFKHFYE